MRERVLIVADDLTGACDAGVAFLAAGLRVRVLLDWTAVDVSRQPEDEVWSVTTESREVDEAEAALRVRAVASRNGLLLFKKVDSAGRGHLRAEVQAAIDVYGARAMVAVAFPAAGRTVREGVLRVADVSGLRSGVVLRDVFAGMTVRLFDAETQAELDELAGEVYRTGERVVWVGSAGLAHGLAKAIGGKALERATAPMGRALLVVGTNHVVTRMQRARLQGEHPVLEVQCGDGEEQRVREAFVTAKVSSLILTGGETAALVLRALGAESLELRGEMARGIPWGVVRGGMADGCGVMTKSGGFGGEDALVQAFEFFQGRVCESA
jgi:uncharacterized protein YgbK (DUF1537 family)